jgi:signal transduction histidine kinase
VSAPEPEQSAREAAQRIADELGRLSAENARLVARLSEGERRFRLISRGVLRVQEAERGRLSRELHDGVGQALTAIKMQLELLEREPPDPASAPRLAELRELAERTLQDVRQISRLLRPPMLDDLGLVATLRWLARTVRERTRLAVELESELQEERLDPDLETLLFRVAQEALTNAAKHASARSARVRLARSPRGVRLLVSDDGAGFDAEALLRADDQHRGFGLRGIRDRVQLFGGRLAVSSTPGRGTSLEVELPLDEHA